MMLHHTDSLWEGLGDTFSGDAIAMAMWCKEDGVPLHNIVLNIQPSTPPPTRSSSSNDDEVGRFPDMPISIDCIEHSEACEWLLHHRIASSMEMAGGLLAKLVLMGILQVVHGSTLNHATFYRPIDEWSVDAIGNNYEIRAMGSGQIGRSWYVPPTSMTMLSLSIIPELMNGSYYHLINTSLPLGKLSKKIELEQSLWVGKRGAQYLWESLRGEGWLITTISGTTPCILQENGGLDNFKLSVINRKTSKIDAMGGRKHMSKGTYLSTKHLPKNHLTAAADMNPMDYQDGGDFDHLSKFHDLDKHEHQYSIMNHSLSSSLTSWISTPYGETIWFHLFRNGLFRKSFLPHRFVCALQIDLMDLKDCYPPQTNLFGSMFGGNTPSVLVYATLKLRRRSAYENMDADEDVTRSPHTLLTTTKRVFTHAPSGGHHHSGGVTKGTWGDLALLRFSLPEILLDYMGIRKDPSLDEVDRGGDRMISSEHKGEEMDDDQLYKSRHRSPSISLKSKCSPPMGEGWMVRDEDLEYYPSLQYLMARTLPEMISSVDSLSASHPPEVFIFLLLWCYQLNFFL